MRRFSRGAAMVAAIALLAAGVVVGERPPQAHSLDGSEFDPGFIIADELFYDGDAMTESQIQAFLESQVAACLNLNCLGVYRQSTDSRTPTVRCPGGYTGGRDETAARILYKVQVGCNISAKVLLVTLQKEQGLITSAAPSAGRLERAMGYYCPDDPTRPGWCDPAYGGFFNQVYNAASQFQRYRLTPTSWGHQIRTQQVRFHPNAACGSKTVTIRNAATAGLYNYTPYTPNAAALANLVATGDACSSYGNRNFWRFYRTWFGPTTVEPPAPAQSALIGSAGDGALWNYPSNGNGAFRPRSPLPADTAGLSLTTGVGDVTGDGQPDLAGVRDGRKIALVEGSKSAGFASVRTVTDFPENVRSILGPGDLTGSGAPDLLVIGESGSLYILANIGQGVFAEPRVVGAGWNAMRLALAPGDLTSNGTSDLLAIDSAGTLFFYEGRGGPRWGARTAVGAGWGQMRLVATGSDLNTDGRPDLLAVDDSGLLWFLAHRLGTRWEPKKQVGSGWRTFTSIGLTSLMPTSSFSPQAGVGDVTSDGSRDAITLDSAGVLAVRPGGKDGTFGSPRPLATWLPGDRVIAAGDFVRNGLIDILRISGADLLVQQIDGAGRLGPATQIGYGWRSMRLVTAPGDVNGDGWGDVLAVDALGDLWLYPGMGDGRFSPRELLGSGLGDRIDLLSVSDWDKDGNVDVLTRASNGRLWLHAGTGSASLRAPVQIGSGWGFAAVFSPGDVSRDGNPDLIAVASDGSARLYMGNGSTGFAGSRLIGNNWTGVVRAQ